MPLVCYTINIHPEINSIVRLNLYSIYEKINLSTLHLTGFFHPHQRLDRDSYIDITPVDGSGPTKVCHGIDSNLDKGKITQYGTTDQLTGDQIRNYTDYDVCSI